MQALILTVIFCLSGFANGPQKVRYLEKSLETDKDVFVHVQY